MNDKISVIVPVYNVKDYVDRCLESILSQIYTNIEVICIDDGSRDESGQICDEYQKKDVRVKVYHIENHGVGYARNYGLSLITGEWFCFIDPDDWIEPEYLSRMYELAVEHNCELVACGVKKSFTHDEKKTMHKEQIYYFRSERECIHNFICNTNSMQGISTNKLYSVSAFRDIRFNTQLKINEDCMYIYNIMSQCKNACLTTFPLYHWFIRPDSACHKRPKMADFSAANVFVFLYEKTLKENDEEVTRTLQCNYINSAIQVLLFAKYKRTDKEVVEAKRKCREWRKYVWRMLECKNKIKYLLALYGPRRIVNKFI